MAIIDNSIFIGMNGAASATQELQVIANNLANANTVGFRADSIYSQPFEVQDGDFQTRTYTKVANNYVNFRQGPITSTDRDLDVAISGQGFFVVQNSQGQEAYTRNGNFQLNKDRLLTDARGFLVMGTDGPINIPQDADKVKIGSDGTVAAKIIGNSDYTLISKLKLVKPDVANLQKGADGMLISSTAGGEKPDDTITVITDSLEGSNVHTIEELTRMIDITRRYEAQMRFIKTLSDNASNSNQLLSITR